MSQDPKSSYYDVGGIETIEIIRAKLTSEQFTGYLLGNILKYSCRNQHKGDTIRDTEKIINYSEMLIKHLKEIKDEQKLGCPTVENLEAYCPGELLDPNDLLFSKRTGDPIHK